MGFLLYLGIYAAVSNIVLFANFISADQDIADSPRDGTFGRTFSGISPLIKLLLEMQERPVFDQDYSDDLSSKSFAGTNIWKLLSPDSIKGLWKMPLRHFRFG